MKSPEPPKAAKWLLNHFGCSPNNDAVIGDLDERRANGRSTAWYWHQVLIALVAGFCHELHIHKGIAIKAVIRGWWLVLLCNWGVAALSWIGDYMAAINSLDGTKLQETVPVVFQMPAGSLVRCLLTAWSMWSYALAGLVVARCNREHRVFPVLCFATTFPVLAFLVRTGTGSTEMLIAVGAWLLILLGGGIFTETATLRHDASSR